MRGAVITHSAMKGVSRLQSCVEHSSKKVPGQTQASGERPAGSVLLCIPLPPPLSSCFKNARARGRVKSGIYKAWITEALHKIAQQKPGHVSGTVRLDMSFGRPDKRKRDLDNLLKATCDLMVSAGIIEDDSNVTELTARWSSEIKGAVVIVERV